MITKNPFKNLKLDDYEQEIETNLPDIELEQDEKTATKFAQYANYTLEKKRNINIRLPEKTLIRLKTQAANLGLPYQTYISSILHQAVHKTKNNNVF